MSKQTTHKKVLTGALSGLMVATGLIGMASSAQAEAPVLPTTGEQLVESTWLDEYFHDALGEYTPIATKASGKWIEYNLSNYCVTLHDGSSVPFQTCQTSSGKEGHATPTGSFTVKRKQLAQSVCTHQGTKRSAGFTMPPSSPAKVQLSMKRIGWAAGLTSRSPTVA